MNLYQFADGHQPHYVAAKSYAQAEKLIAAARYSPPEFIKLISVYLLLPEEEKP